MDEEKGAAVSVDTDRHMRPSDAFAWYMERDPVLRSTVVVVGLLDRSPDSDRLRATFDRALNVVPSLRDRLLQPPLRMARPRWARVADADLDWHIRRVAVPAPGEVSQVLEIARIAATSAFDPVRPLWTFTVVDGLPGGCAAFVLAFHHSLTDGLGGVALAQELFDLERHPAAPRGPVTPADSEQLDGWRLPLDTALYNVNQLAKFGRALPGTALRMTATLVRHPLRAMQTAASVARVVEPYFTTLSPVMRERRLGRSLHVLEVPLEEMREAARARGGRLNDAFLAAVTGGLRRYHDEHGEQINELRVTLPLSLRAEDDPAGGNRITLLRFPLPAGIADAGERLDVIHEEVLRIRGERSLPYTQHIAAALNLLPAGVVGSMLKHVDFLASDVPGTPIPLYLAGAKIEKWYPFGPTIGAALNVTLMSYVDTCCIGVNVDTGAVSDPDRLVACFEEGFLEVLALGARSHGDSLNPEGVSWTS